MTTPFVSRVPPQQIAHSSAIVQVAIGGENLVLHCIFVARTRKKDYFGHRIYSNLNAC